MEDETTIDSDISEFRMLNPVSKKAMYLSGAITIAVAVAFAAFGLYVSDAVAAFPWVLPLAVVVVVLIAAYELISPSIFYKHYRYRMDEDCIEVRRGVIFHSHTLVPVERIHQVNVSKGPILRKFGLADVTITTAGGVATLQFLDEEIAEYIASNLNDKIVAMLRARE